MTAAIFICRLQLFCCNYIIISSAFIIVKRKRLRQNCAKDLTNVDYFSRKNVFYDIFPSLTAKKRRELINKGFLRFLNCPKRSYILLLFLGFPYYSFHADIRQDLIIRSKTCHLMKPVGKVCPGIGRQISLLFTRPVHVH